MDEQVMNIILNDAKTLVDRSSQIIRRLIEEEALRILEDEIKDNHSNNSIW